MTDLEFLKGCGIAPDSPDAELACRLRKLWAAGSLRLSEDEITAEIRLGELAPQWFPPEDLNPDTHEEKILAWGICLGEYYDALYSVNPQPDWTIGELVRNVFEAAEAKNNQVVGRKMKPWQEYVVALFFVFVLSFLMTGFYSLRSDTAWSWRIWGVICVAGMVIAWCLNCKKPEEKP